MQQFQQQSWTSWIYKESPMPLSIVTELVVAVILVVLVFFFLQGKKKQTFLMDTLTFTGDIGMC